MGARILILQEEPGPAEALKESLGSRHQLLFANSHADAMRILAGQNIDLIIARVHLENTNVFDFLRIVKRDPQLHKIPFICFCGRHTHASKAFDPVLARSSEALGADKYISADDFLCGSHYDFEKMRGAVESCLPEQQ